MSRFDEARVGSLAIHPEIQIACRFCWEAERRLVPSEWIVISEHRDTERSLDFSRVIACCAECKDSAPDTIALHHILHLHYTRPLNQEPTLDGTPQAD